MTTADNAPGTTPGTSPEPTEGPAPAAPAEEGAPTEQLETAQQDTVQLDTVQLGVAGFDAAQIGTEHAKRTEALPTEAPTTELGATGATTELPVGEGAAGAGETRALPTEGGATDWRSAEYSDNGSAAGVPPVWTAASTAVGGTPVDGRPVEAPPRGVRVGQLIWAGIVILLGIFLIGLALLPNLDVTTALIGLVALLGVGLIIAAWATSRRSRG